MDKAIIQMVLIVTEAAMVAKDKGNDVFVEYMPHIKLLKVQIYYSRWTPENKHYEDIRIYLDSKDVIEQLTEVLYKIQNI